jgi:hypothetical protein
LPAGACLILKPVPATTSQSDELTSTHYGIRMTGIVKIIRMITFSNHHNSLKCVILIMKIVKVHGLAKDPSMLYTQQRAPSAGLLGVAIYRGIFLFSILIFH